MPAATVKTKNAAGELAEYLKPQNNGEGELSDDDASAVGGGIWMDVGAGWIWVDDTVPTRKREPALKDFKIDIIPE